MTSIVCGLCGGPLSVAFATTDRNRHVSHATFTYYRCDICGTLRLAPVPNDLDHYYPAEYYDVPNNLAELRAFQPPERYKVEILQRFAPTGRLVEIGPGIGAFATVAQSVGYETSVIEMDAGCCQFLRAVAGLEVHETADPAGALATHGPFDVIAMWHVIEHLRNPREVLAAAASALRPGGVVALAAPNPNSLQFRIFRSSWAHVDAPRHLFLIPIGALVGIARELGLHGSATARLLETRAPSVGTCSDGASRSRGSCEGSAR